MIKQRKKTVTVGLVLMLLLSVIATIFLANPQKAYAESPSWQDESAHLSSTLNLNINGEKKNLEDYESYLDTIFEPKKEQVANDKFDEWILNIIPKYLFDNPGEYTYFGDAYGFFMDYDSSQQVYFLYLFLTKSQQVSVGGQPIDGHYFHEIKPLYYENYCYDKSTGKVSLEYIKGTKPMGSTTYEYYYYQKLSDIKDIYIKDVSFGASVYNENHLNQADLGYNANFDNGSFFVGTNYQYKGVSLKHGQTDFANYVFKSVLGYVPGIKDLIGIASKADDLIANITNLVNGINTDFRDTLTNEQNWGTDILDIGKIGQIEKYQGLLKDAATALITDNTSPVLFGINRDSYIKATYYLNTTSQWKNRLVQNIQFQIVEDKSILSTPILNVLHEVDTNDVYKTIYENSSITLTEESNADVYLLQNSHVVFSFTALENGQYTFETLGDVENIILLNGATISNNVDGINQTAQIELSKGETIIIETKAKADNSLSRYRIKVVFTPNNINVGENKNLNVKPGETEFVSIVPAKLSAYDFNINASGTLGVAVSFGNLSNRVVGYKETQNDTGSFVSDLEGRYYISIYNPDSEIANISISINEVETLNENISITNNSVFERIYLFKPEYSCGYNINVSAQYSLQAYLFNSEFSMIAENGGNNIQINRALTSGGSYYLLAKPSIKMPFTFLFTPNPTNLQLGSNTLTKSEYTQLYGYKSLDTDVVINLNSYGLNSIKLFDCNMNEKNDGLILQGQQYYIGVKGESNDFIIDMEISNSNIDGVISSNGFNFIKVNCGRTGNYLVKGVTSYAWFTDNIISYQNYLTSNNTYYLKIEGTPGASYSVEISYDAPELILTVRQNIDAGYYKLAADSGDYSFRTYSAKGVTTILNIYDSNHNIVYGDINASTAKILHLDTDTYYIDVVVTNSTKTTIQIVQQN